MFYFIKTKKKIGTKIVEDYYIIILLYYKLVKTIRKNCVCD